MCSFPLLPTSFTRKIGWPPASLSTPSALKTLAREVVRRPTWISFVGLKNSKEFKKLLLRAAAAKRNGRNMSRDDVENFLQDSRTLVESPSRPAPAPGLWGAASPPQDNSSSLTVEKLDQLNATMGRMENLLSRFLEQASAASPEYLPVNAKEAPQDL